MKEYVNIKSNKWTITVKWCLKIGFVLGLVMGGIIAYNTL